MPHTNPIFPDFAGQREWRRHHYAGWDSQQTAKRSRAIVTMVRDESQFLPIWLGYYSQFFSPEDIYVLDHDTKDGSTSVPGFHRIAVSHETTDMHWMLQQITEMQHKLMQKYDIVVVCDVDEIIAPDPASPCSDLGQYLDRMDEDFVCCLGYEVIHQPEVEPPIDIERPLLAQRSTWYHNPLYDKPAIAMIPMNWVPGFHRRTDGLNNYDPDLRLIHLHRVDIDRCYVRNVERSAFRRQDDDAAIGLAEYNWITDRAEFERWFHIDTVMANVPMRLEPLEPRWHAVI